VRPRHKVSLNDSSNDGRGDDTTRLVKPALLGLSINYMMASKAPERRVRNPVVNRKLGRDPIF